MKKLVLIRHGESEWNKLNLFTGWTDVPLSEQGKKEALEGAKTLKVEGYDFDICFTSYLKRAIHTLNIVLDEMDRNFLPVHKTWRLNERHYGALQGLNKSETAAKYGEEQVKIWRRSFDVRPPELAPNDERSPRNMIAYRDVDKNLIPLAECLKDTIARVVPYYEENIKPAMDEGKRVLVVAHGNSIRSLVKYIENISDDEITAVNIPTGIPLVYELEDDYSFIKKYYLGDAEKIKLKIESVKNQGKKK